MRDWEAKLKDFSSGTCNDDCCQENAGLANAIDAALAEIERLRAEKDALLQGLEELGWPCRLAELPSHVKSLNAEVERLRAGAVDHLAVVETEMPKIVARVRELEEALKAARAAYQDLTVEINDAGVWGVLSGHQLAQFSKYLDILGAALRGEDE